MKEDVPMSDKPNYRVNIKDVEVRRARPTTTPDGEFKSTQRIYGLESSLLFADRDPGYHTNPHRHDCEQLNYVLSGEIWFFIENKSWRCREGDIMRIPRDKVHWAWVRGTENCSVIEVHTPPLPGNGEVARKAAHSLLADDEELTDDRCAQNARVEMDKEEVSAVEAKAIAQEEELLGS
jgi:mannose-6-phosphate isomerase-like protein (cupin superfamily)